MKKFLEIFQPLRPLLQDEAEWAGAVGPDGLFLSRGDKNSAKTGMSPQKEREFVEAGWVFFHTHPAGQPPSWKDRALALIRGSEFILTPRGVWKIEPEGEDLPLEELLRFYEEAWERAEKDPLVLLGKVEPYWAWVEIFFSRYSFREEFLPWPS